MMHLVAHGVWYICKTHHHKSVGALVSLLDFFKGGCIGYIECNLFVLFLDFVMEWQLFVGESSFPRSSHSYFFSSCFTAHLVSVIFQLKAKWAKVVFGDMLLLFCLSISNKFQRCNVNSFWSLLAILCHAWPLVLCHFVFNHIRIMWNWWWQRLPQNQIIALAEQ
jgi:hypothetical protein